MCFQMKNDPNTQLNTYPNNNVNAMETLTKQQLLEAAAREACVRAGTDSMPMIYSLGEMGSLTQQSWDNSLPTLTHSDACEEFGKTEFNNFGEFESAYIKAHTFLNGVNLDNLLIAGGSVAHNIQKRTRPNGKLLDVDVFVYDLSPEQATERAAKFLNDIQHAHEIHGIKGYRADLTEAFRKQSVASTKDIGKQEILKEAIAACTHLLDSAPGELPLDKFDMVTLAQCLTNGESDQAKLGRMVVRNPFEYSATRSENCISVTINGKEIQVITRVYKSKAEILHGFDIPACSVGYDGNDVYFTPLALIAHEANIIMVDPYRCSQTYEARLNKYFTRGFQLAMPGFAMDNIPRDNMVNGIHQAICLPTMTIIASSVDGNRIFTERITMGHESSSDYADCDQPERVAYNNLHRLVNNSGQLTALTPDCRKLVGIITALPHMSVKMINAIYDAQRKTAWQGGKLNLGMLRRYSPPGLSITKIIQAWEEDGDIESAVRELTGLSRGEALAKYTANRENVGVGSIHWRMENPCGHPPPLTGAFNPHPRTSAEFYGHYSSHPIFR